jgi:hypothetical protein
MSTSEQHTDVSRHDPLADEPSTADERYHADQQQYGDQQQQRLDSDPMLARGEDGSTDDNPRHADAGDLLADDPRQADRGDLADDSRSRDDLARDDLRRDDMARDDMARDDMARDDVTRDDLGRDDTARDDLARSDTGGGSAAEDLRTEAAAGGPTTAGSATAGSATAGSSSAGGADENRTPLVPRDRADQFAARWNEVKGMFVDEPRAAVQQADALVGELLDDLERSFREQRQDIEQGLDNDDTSTEDLRMALRRYRSFFDRLLSV